MEAFSLYSRRLKEGEFHPRIEAYYYKQWDDFRMTFHDHNRAEIMYVISGQCTVDTDRESLSLKKGELILLDAGVRHRLLVAKEQPCRMLNIEFVLAERESACPSLRELAAADPALQAFLAEELPYVVLKDPSDVYYTLKSLVLKLDDDEPGRTLMVGLLFSQLLLQVAKLFAETQPASQGQSELYVRQAMEYIHQHYDCNLQVKDIAAAVSVHPGYLHRVFKRYAGLTVLEYVTSYRIDKAKMLLAKADVPITEIADYIGMNSRQYFSSVFRKYTGQTPQQFRKSMRTSSWSEPEG